MNKKIIISLAVIGVAAAIAVTGTVAFFSDTETSTGNLFTAGAIDLKIDNECYGSGGYTYGSDCTWTERDLDGELFFNFSDLKPGDWGEDTVSLHVYSNDAWACVTFDNMVDYDNACTEPEAEDGDTSCGNPGPEEGELSDELYFFFWADMCSPGSPGGGPYKEAFPGDNIFQPECDRYLMDGLASDILPGTTYTLAALGEYNVFTGVLDEPLTGSVDYYIGKAWCFGEMIELLLDGTVVCDGGPVNNMTQTDSLEADIIFYAEQSRNNPNFVCPQPVVVTPCTGWDCLAGLDKDFFVTGRYGDGNPTAGAWELAIWEVDGGETVVDQDNYGWTSQVAVDFSLDYDPTNGSITYVVGGKTLNWTYSFNKAFSHIIPFAKGNASGNNTLLSNLVVDGINLPDLDSGNTYKGLIVPLSDAQQADGFTVTGKATLTWSGSPANELPAFHVFAMGTHDL